MTQSRIPNNRWTRSSLSDSTVDKLTSLTESKTYSGVIPAELAKWCAEKEQIDMVELMARLLPWAASYAFPPISEFYVGAMLRGVSGNLYCGVNIEFAGQPLNFAIHGEQSAFANAYHHGEKAVDTLCVSDAPCGHCRQYMHEFCDDSHLQIKMVRASGVIETTLAALLPYPFGPSALGVSATAFSAARKHELPHDTEDADLKNLAREYAIRSYAPYSKCFSGVALRTNTGRTFGGSYIESCAFNPSLPAVQSAFASLVVSGEHPSSVVDAVMVHHKGGNTDQVPSGLLALHAMAPNASFNQYALT